MGVLVLEVNVAVLAQRTHLDEVHEPVAAQARAHKLVVGQRREGQQQEGQPRAIPPPTTGQGAAEAGQPSPKGRRTDGQGQREQG